LPLNETVLGIAAAHFPHFNFDANLEIAPITTGITRAKSAPHNPSGSIHP
jgi:hypothetical protein